MSRKQWYEELFEDYGRKYDNEIFTQGTIGEDKLTTEDYEMLVIANLKNPDFQCLS